VYIGRDEKFFSHSGVYDLKLLTSPGRSTSVLGGPQTGYPSDKQEFGGLYGYQNTYG